MWNPLTNVSDVFPSNIVDTIGSPAEPWSVSPNTSCLRSGR